jgi:hypothetical protein
MTHSAGLVAAAALLAAATAPLAPAHAAVPDAVAREHWRQALVRATLPPNACFKANYPDTAWTRVACAAAPTHKYLPRNASLGSAGNTVGNGHDYAAVVVPLISSGTGSFPSITGLTSEKNLGQSNEYSLQLNSNFFNGAVCSGAKNPSSCLAWQQFVYSNQNGAEAFMQYWLINWGNKCPSGGWMADGSDCYKNSAAVGVPRQALSQLGNLSVTGSAVANGTDKMVLMTATSAYTTTGPDSVVQLADGWTQSEYNVIGNGDGSKASFNTGTSITVQIALDDGATAAPTCKNNDGTTGETNNLTLGACKTFSGTPTVSFVESN